MCTIINRVRVYMKDNFKKVLKIIEMVFAVLFIISLVFNFIDKTVISMNTARVFALIVTILHIISIVTKNSKGDYAMLIVFALAVAVLISASSTVAIHKKDYYDDSPTGVLKREIYDQSGVNVYFNFDLMEDEKVKLTYTTDYNISEEQAIESLKIIKEELARYEKGLPSKIYLVNDFKMRGADENGVFVVRKNFIILNNNSEDIRAELHHQMGHSIENKSYDLLSFLKFRTVKSSCNLVSDKACESNNELFAETWKTKVYDNKTTDYSNALSPIFDTYLK